LSPDVCHAHPDPRIFIKECRSLAEFGHEVHLVTTNVDSETVGGVHIHGIKKPAKGTIHRFTATVRDVYREAKRIDADLYHFHDAELIPAGLLLKRMGKIVVYDVHEDVPRDIMLKKWMPRPLRLAVSKVFERFEAYAAEKFDGIVTATPKLNERFEKINPMSVNIINYPQLSECHFTGAGDRRDSRTVCCVGYITQIRGVYEMVEAIGLTESTLLLGGTFSYESEYEQARRSAGWERVRHMGWLKREQVIETLSQAAAGLVVLHPTDTFIESLPVTMFKYMSAGIPVIASDFPLWRAIIEKSQCGI
jgi:glycosyltransferase involved in cell wall biosynthesis